MSDTRRIAKNTLMLYFRQILIMLVSLYTVRVVLSVLGAEDYGIYNVVAGVVTMFGFLSGAMATASQRYFSFDLGKGDSEHLKTTFSVTLQIYILFAFLIVVLAETLGIWFVNHMLVIPHERILAANWVFQTSVVRFLFVLVTTPYMSATIAHENMSVYAYASIVEVVLQLLSVFILRMIPYDLLIVYGSLLVMVSGANFLLYYFYCVRKYQECHLQFVGDVTLFKEIVTYTGWNLFGAGVGVVKNQLVDITLNFRFGVLVNAARTVAMQVNTAASSFSSNFSVAVNPWIIKLYAAGKKEQMLLFTFQTMRFAYLLMLWISMPLMFEMPAVLAFWLKTLPEHTVIFARLALVDALVNAVSYTFGTAIQATGRIRNYQIVVGTVLLCNFPISVLMLKRGFNAEVVFYVAIIISVLALILRLGFMSHILAFKLSECFVVQNCVRILICTGLCMGLLFFYKHIISLHFIVSLLFEYILCLLLIILFGIRQPERMLAYQYIRKWWKK